MRKDHIEDIVIEIISYTVRIAIFDSSLLIPLMTLFFDLSLFFGCPSELFIAGRVASQNNIFADVVLIWQKLLD